MKNVEVLRFALDNCLKKMTAEQLKALCDEQIDSLVKSLPKEAGGSKVMMEGQSRGIGAAKLTVSNASEDELGTVGSLGVR
jgi:hypothetical protein